MNRCFVVMIFFAICHMAVAKIGHSDTLIVKSRGGSKTLAFYGDTHYIFKDRKGTFNLSNGRMVLYTPSGKVWRKFKYTRGYIHYAEGGLSVREDLRPLLPWRKRYSTH